MASRRGDFTEVLLFKGVISPEQLAEAQMLASEQKRSVADCLQNLDYATGEEVVRAMERGAAVLAAAPGDGRPLFHGRPEGLHYT